MAIGEVTTGARIFLPNIQTSAAVERAVVETVRNETATETLNDETPGQEQAAQRQLFLPTVGR